MTAARPYPFSEPDGLTLDPAYADLREHAPLARIRMPYGEEAWLVTRFDDARVVLGDPRFSRAASLEHDQPRVTPEAPPLGILDMDPPDHTRLRRLVAKAFTTRRVELLRPRIEEIAAGLLDGVRAAGPPADLVELFAIPLPVAVICELLGVPYDDRDDFQTWSEALLTTTSLTDDQRMSYLANLATYMAGLIAQRRVKPTADLLSAMVQARDADDRLSEDELLFLAIGLLAAGHETTASQIPNFVYLLLTHPDQLALLRDHPELLPGGVEELMRYVPFTAVSTIPRYASEDVELAGGVVRAGEPAIVSRSAANRDPSVFPDPERLDVTRTLASHFGFGYGAHHCLGAQLARVELQVALGTLLTGLPGLRLAATQNELPWKKGLLMRGLHRILVAWDTP